MKGGEASGRIRVQHRPDGVHDALKALVAKQASRTGHVERFHQVNRDDRFQPIEAADARFGSDRDASLARTPQDRHAGKTVTNLALGELFEAGNDLDLVSHAPSVSQVAKVSRQAARSSGPPKSRVNGPT